MANYRNDEDTAPYDGSCKVPNEITDIDDPIMFGLNWRKIIIFAIASVLVGAELFLFLKILHFYNSVVILIIVAITSAPFGVFALWRPSGLNLEDYLVILKCNLIKSKSVRKLFSENEFEKVYKIAKNKRKSTKKKKPKKKRKKNQKIYHLRQ
jgi:hypothetical protein